MLVQQRDGLAHAEVGLHGDERRELAGVALAAQDVADGQVGVALEEPVLAHPRVGVDLGQVRRGRRRGGSTTTIASGSSISAATCERGVQRQPARAAGEDPLGVGEPARGEERVAVGDRHPAIDRRGVEGLGPEVLAHPLDEVWADVLLRPRSRSSPRGRRRRRPGPACARAGSGLSPVTVPPVPTPTTRWVIRPAGLLPELRPGRLVVGLRVGLVEVLVGLKRARGSPRSSRSATR